MGIYGKGQPDLLAESAMRGPLARARADALGPDEGDGDGLPGSWPDPHGPDPVVFGVPGR